MPSAELELSPLNKQRYSILTTPKNPTVAAEVSE